MTKVKEMRTKSSLMISAIAVLGLTGLLAVPVVAHHAFGAEFYPNRPVLLKGKVTKLSPIPVSSGKFAMEIEIEESELPAWLVPGMANKSTISTYTKKDAIVVPTKAVHDEEEDDSKKFVWIVAPRCAVDAGP